MKYRILVKSSKKKQYKTEYYITIEVFQYTQ